MAHFLFNIHVYNFLVILGQQSLPDCLQIHQGITVPRSRKKIVLFNPNTNLHCDLEYETPPHQENMSVTCIPPYTPLLYSKTGVRRGLPFFLIFALKHR